MIAKDASADPFARWKEARRTLASERAFWHVGLVLVVLVALTYVVRSLEDWEATALSTVLIFCLTELTSYYFSYLVLLAPFCVRRTGYVAALVGVAIGTQLAHLSLDWVDDIHTLDSALVALLFAYLLGSEILRAHSEPSTASSDRAIQLSG